MKTIAESDGIDEKNTPAGKRERLRLVFSISFSEVPGGYDKWRFKILYEFW
jgi:hypothetical protein